MRDLEMSVGADGSLKVLKSRKWREEGSDSSCWMEKKVILSYSEEMESISGKWRSTDDIRQLCGAWETMRSVKTIDMNKLEVRGSRCSSVSVTGDECSQGKGQWMSRDWSIPMNSALLLNRRLLEYWHVITKPVLSVSKGPDQIRVKMPRALISWKTRIEIKSFCWTIPFT